jgi:hypothetical protein
MCVCEYGMSTMYVVRRYVFARQSLVYRHVSATWDEPSLEERERAMGFQTSTTNHTKVIRLERNALLGRSMDLNPLT